jgi:hypothetical protein
MLGDLEHRHEMQQIDTQFLDIIKPVDQLLQITGEQVNIADAPDSLVCGEPLGLGIMLLVAENEAVAPVNEAAPDIEYEIFKKVEKIIPVPVEHLQVREQVIKKEIKSGNEDIPPFGLASMGNSAGYPF